TPEAINLLNQNSFKVVLITNQSGIERGYFDEITLASIHKKLEIELARHSAHLDGIYYCPHHPDKGCDCRKPKTALFRRAAKELDIDFEKSFMIGDMQIDIEAGKKLGCRTVLVTTGPKGGKDIVNPASFTAPSLMEAVQWIINNSKPTLNAKTRT
ncbi:D-glycero-alpha-D-manno-heptose-1,7-bisphosphate 7-phosphatase, partial [Chloroflexota bacterium]